MLVLDVSVRECWNEIRTLFKKSLFIYKKKEKWRVKQNKTVVTNSRGPLTFSLGVNEKKNNVNPMKLMITPKKKQKKKEKEPNLTYTL